MTNRKLLNITLHLSSWIIACLISIGLIILVAKRPDLTVLVCTAFFYLGWISKSFLTWVKKRIEKIID